MRTARIRLACLLVGVVVVGTGIDAPAQRSQTRVPANATANVYGGWSCNDGYIKRDEGCVTVAQATDEEVRQHLVDQSISAYSGSCPCPYNRDRAGRRFGRRSAYSRPGGASPLCYTSDVNESAVKRFRARYAKGR